ncbi:hypothetical protein [Mucilaginibacter sp. CSA2-8R]|uniref:hypothetical protein n=1 Tax=Mucilaginibacter sp. CSA2-8R TaxID=3141542 RepID=UPI00315DD0DE
MSKALTYVFVRIFVNGFYQAHAGLFLFFFLFMIGAVDPAQLLNYHKTLMLALVSSPVMLLLVFAVWLLYAIKSVHYVTGQINAPTQQFLYYSAVSFSKQEQFKSWFTIQSIIFLPVTLYGLLAAGVGLSNHQYLLPLLIVVYLLLLTALGAWIYTIRLNRLIASNNGPAWLQWSSGLKKPLFSLYIYHILHQFKLPFIITKALSWLIIASIFWLFADVKHDARVAGMAVLAIGIAHAILVFEHQKFEQVYLTWVRNFPYAYIKRCVFAALTYSLLLLPEAVWLLSRFNIPLAVNLFLIALSMLMLLHALLSYIGLNMDKYLQWLMGLFILLFWIMMFKLTWPLIACNVLLSYWLFRQNYGRDLQVVNGK